MSYTVNLAPSACCWTFNSAHDFCNVILRN